MPRWNGPRLTKEQKKAKKRQYDRARNQRNTKAALRGNHDERVEAFTARRNTVRHEQLGERTTRYDPLETPAISIPVAAPDHGLKIALLMDAQVKPGVPVDHLSWYGRYLAEKRPDVIVCIGDFADMPSLSSYAAPGSLEGENARYREDVDSVKRAMAAFLEPIVRVPGWSPRLVTTLGNHEDRIDRAIQAAPRQLEGVISVEDLGYREFGWEVYPYLQPVVIGGVAFCHFFPSGVMGHAITTAAGLIRKMHMSCVAGHLQGRDIAYGRHADGRTITAIISGSFYQHDESYLSPLANQHWRGTYMLHEVKEGCFDEMALSINFLQRRYGR
jgi:hypothetical protein